MFTEVKKRDRTWKQKIENSASVDAIIQTLIDIAHEEGPDGVVIMTKVDCIAIYVSADSDVAEVRSHYDRARKSGMVRA